MIFGILILHNKQKVQLDMLEWKIQDVFAI